MSDVVLTIDNLGEANELERGTWPGTHALGAHPSVTVALPRLLDELARHRLRATFCVEAINCRLCPEVVTAIARAGHELAAHGYRHERWADLSRDREAELLARSRMAFAALGLEPTGFRPPGGGLTPDTPRLLVEHRFTWASPAREAVPASTDPAGPTWVPFAWEDVDALYRLPSFDGLRRSRGLPASAVSAERAGRAIAGVLDDPGRRIVVLHPFLMLDPAWWESVRRLLAQLAARVAAGSARCLTAGEAAA